MFKNVKNFQKKMLTYLSFEHADFTIHFQIRLRIYYIKSSKKLCTCTFKLNPVFLLIIFHNNPSFVYFISLPF